MSMLSAHIQDLLDRYHVQSEEDARLETSEEEKIHVDEIASKLAMFYEKVRSVVDYREAHLLRKGSIERTLRRRILLREFDGDVAESLIKDLVRAGHLKNDSVPTRKIPEVKKILDNLIYLVRHGGRDGEAEWLVKVFVSAIEEELFPVPKEKLLVKTMFETMKSSLILRHVPMSSDEIEIQLFVAVQRALLRADRDQIFYELLKNIIPGWGKLSEQELIEAAKKMPDLKIRLNKIWKEKLASHFLQLCNREKTIFLLAGDLVANNVIAEESADTYLRSLYKERYIKNQTQLRRLAMLSVISFLVSKILVALLVEIPLDRAWGYSSSLNNILVNVTFPPLLMAAIVAMIRPPSARNYQLIADGVREVMWHEGERTYLLAVPKKRSKAREIVIYSVYVLVLGVILYYLSNILNQLDFSPISILIFIIFTSMVVATGVKVNNRSKEMSVEKRKATMGSFVLDLVTVPFTAIGRWTIAGLSRFNIITIIFNFFIELPFQLFVEFIEGFRAFIKERKDELG